MKFEIGGQVQCIEGGVWENPDGTFHIGAPWTGDILTVKGIERCADDVYLQLEGDEAYFESAGFRPLPRKPTSIEVFHQIRRDASIRQVCDA